MKVVAINDPFMDAFQIAYLLVHDSVHGRLCNTVKATAENISIDGNIIQVFAFKQPESIPWLGCNVDFVAETSGVFNTTDKATGHLYAGAKKVVISAPPKGFSFYHKIYCILLY
jgi:glyceraldehyde 3-phosphate dehydrogenase